MFVIFFPVSLVSLPLILDTNSHLYQLSYVDIGAFNVVYTNCFFFLFIFATEGLPNTKLHTLILDHQNVKLTWYIDWPKKEILFNVDDAFTDDNDWFSFGFSKRGKIEGSDVCYFVKSFYDESYNEAIVSIV